MPTSKSAGRTLTYLPYLTIVIIVACSFITAYGMTFLGDDLNHGMRTHEKFPHWYQWPLAIPYQWLTGNGRFGDMIGNILLAEAPMWLLASLSAVMEGLLYLMAIKISFPHRKAVLPRLLTLAVILFVFPWWDSFFLFVCRINYIWSAALTLFVLWITLFKKGETPTIKWGWLLPVIAMAAGWGHEACGMPVAAGLVLYFLFIRKFSTLPKLSRVTIIAFVIGAVLSVTSPCSYSRLGNVSSPDDTVPVLILKSSSIVLILILSLIIALCFKGGRKKVVSLCRDSWIVLAVAAMCSTLFVAVGGVVGRSGIFSQMYSLIALGILIRSLAGERRVVFTNLPMRLVSVLLFLIMSAHIVGVCAYQIEGNWELKYCRILYERSSDGVIYASPRQRNEFPWWTLMKNKACVDNDDFWLVEVYDLRIGKDRKHYRLLPETLKDPDRKDLDSVAKASGGWIEREIPDGVDPDNIMVLDGIQYTVVEFTSVSGQTLYYVSPRIIDPGDR